MLRRLAWSSIASTALAGVDLDRIVARWRRNNERRHISGMLLFTDAHFLGILEGHAHDLESLWLRLQTDRRHRDLVRIGDDRCGHRWFPEWRMAYADPSLSAREIEALRSPQARIASKWATTIRPIMLKASALSTRVSYRVVTRSRSYLVASSRRRANSFLTAS